MVRTGASNREGMVRFSKVCSIARAGVVKETVLQV
jgi:hypothetical protein